MPLLEPKDSVDQFVEDVRGYDADWTSEISEEDISEDEDFMYLEIDTEDYIRDEFMDMGRYLDARSTGEVNNGERYVLAVEK